MNRRTFTAASGLAAAARSAAAAPPKSVLELRFVRLRNNSDNQRARLTDFLKNSVLPAAARVGAGPVGFFSGAIGLEGPVIVTLMSFPSLAAYEQAGLKLAGDAQYAKDLAALHGRPGLAYMRMEVSLLRGFDGFPGIEVPPPLEQGSRIFEVRVYESNNPLTLRRKMKMFDDGETAIFRRLNMLPVFFGETIAGRNMPNLTYMLAFESLAAREKSWRAFGSDPGWQKMRALPGLSDAEVVSNITNYILSPLPFSPIR